MARTIRNVTITRNRGGFLTMVVTPPYQVDLLVANTIVQKNYNFDEDGEPLDCAPAAICQQSSDGPIYKFCNLSAPPEWLALQEGCINADPGFVDLDGGDYELTEDSACVDAGSNAQALNDSLDVNDNGVTVGEKGPDLLLRERIRRGSVAVCVPTVDMGAFERQGYCALGDLDGDNDVDGGDIGALLAMWGPCSGSPCTADLDCDGQVGGGDLGLLLGGWGPGCPRACDPLAAMAAMALLGEGEEGAGGGAGDGSVSLAELADSLGFATMEDFVQWLTGLPFGEMSFFLELLGG